MATTESWLPQFSLRTFLIAIAVLGVGLAAVLSASEAWALALAIAFNLLLPTAVVLAIVLAGRSRAFWIGVAVFGVSCSLFFADKGDFLANRVSSDVWNLIQENLSVSIVRLHSDRIEREAERKAAREADRMAARMSKAALATRIQGRRASYVHSASYQVQTLATTSASRFLMILIALGGGCLGCWAYRHRGQGSSSNTGTGGDGG